MGLLELKSGSDVRGVALENYGEEVNLTDENVKAIVGAFVLFLKNRLGGKDLTIGLGHDSRLSSERIKNASLEALKECGVKVLDSGLSSTPSMFMMTANPETDCDGAIMITASHHPVQKNGLKFFTKNGGLEGDDITNVLEMAERGEKAEGEKSAHITKDYMKGYCDSLVSFVRDKCGEEEPLKGFKIVVDAGNGVGGFYVDRVLKPLGADTQGSQFLNPDGSFPNHAPNPEDKAAMRAISNCVKDNSADLGIIFDTDVDRAAIVGKDGSEINRNKLIALVSAILLEEQPEAYIVTDSVTSDGLRKFIEKRGGIHHRYKRGYKNVIDEAVKLNKDGKNAPIAIETSGHAALRENHFLDDGAYLVTRLLVKAAKLRKEEKELTDLIADLELPAEDAEVRLAFKTEDWKEYGATILENLADFTRKVLSPEPSTYEGVRGNVDYAKGWFLARMSVHDPIMPVNIECSEKGGVKLIAKLLYKFFAAFAGIDSEPLRILAGE